MAKFECNLCGKCCRSFGEFITIERQMSTRDYYCKYGITNDHFFAHVEGDYVDRVSETVSDRTAGAPLDHFPCPFLQENQEGKGFICAIYATRPHVCREFRCYRMLIYNSEGILCGRVLGQNEIKTMDERLANLWKQTVVHLPHRHPSGANDPVWVNSVISLLGENGYRTDPVE